MSLVRFDRSPDLQRLRNEGYTVSVEESGHVVVRDVPYLTPAGEVAFGVLVAPLSTSGDAAAQPPNHQVWFVGQAPSNRRGERLRNLINSEDSFLLSATLEAQFHFSTKPAGKDNYDDYYEMFSNYATILEAHAQSVDPGVTAKRFRPVADEDPTSPFMYLDSASSRAGVAAYASRLELPRVAIVGLGGTGSYVLNANPYEYCTADPINCVDLDGRWGHWKWLHKVAKIAAVVSYVGYVPFCAVCSAVGTVAGLASAAAYGINGEGRNARKQLIGTAWSVGLGGFGSFGRLSRLSKVRGFRHYNRVGHHMPGAFGAIDRVLKARNTDHVIKGAARGYWAAKSLGLQALTSRYLT